MAIVSEFGGSVLKDKERCFDSLIPHGNPVAMCFNRFGGPWVTDNKLDLSNMLGALLLMRGRVVAGKDVIEIDGLSWKEADPLRLRELWEHRGVEEWCLCCFEVSWNILKNRLHGGKQQWEVWWVGVVACDPREVTDVDFRSQGLIVIQLRILSPASLSHSANILFVLLFLRISSDISVTGSCGVNTWCVKSLISIKDLDNRWQVLSRRWSRCPLGFLPEVWELCWSSRWVLTNIGQWSQCMPSWPLGR